MQQLPSRLLLLLKQKPFFVFSTKKEMSLGGTGHGKASGSLKEAGVHAVPPSFCASAGVGDLIHAIWYNPTLLTHHFSPTFRPFCAVFSPFFRGLRLPGAKTERMGDELRKMGEIWGRNGRETAVT